MAKIIREGYTITIALPEERGYKDYYARCTYKYIKSKERYRLSMWLKHNSIDDTFKIDAQEIDSQLVNCTRENIEENICKLVEYMAVNGLFNSYIEAMEYTYKCFDRGNELFENERLAQVNDDKE